MDALRDLAVSKRHLFNGMVVMFLRLMKLMWFLDVALLVLLLVSTVCTPVIYAQNYVAGDLSNEEFFFGVTFGGNTTSEAKLLIDEVKGYTNLFVINSWEIRRGWKCQCPRSKSVITQ